MPMGFGNNLTFWQSFPIYLLYLWSIIWKGIALWKAAKNDQRNWFVVLLFISTFGVLELVYLFRFAKKRMTISEIRIGLRRIFYGKAK
jgi:hypothetical protein